METDPYLPQRASIRLPGYDYTQPGAYFVTLCTQGREALFGEIVNGEMRLSAAGRVAAAEWRRLSRQFPGIRVDAFVVMPNHMHGIIVIEDVGATLNVGATRRGQIRRTGGAENGKNNASSGEGGSPVNTPNVHLLQTTVDGPARATLIDENETIPGANMGQNDSRSDQYGSPLRDASDVGATRRGQMDRTDGTENGKTDTRSDEAGSPVSTEYNTHPTRPNGPAAGSLGVIIGQFKARATRRIRSVPGYEQIPVWQRNYYEHIIRNETEWGMITEYIKNNPERWEQDRLNPIAPENPLMQGKTNGE